MTRPLSFLSALGALVLAACSTMPPPLEMGLVDPAEVTAKAAHSGLVPVTRQDASIKVDQRYATARNVFGRVLYPTGFPALASEPTASKLAAANAAVRRHGLTLLVWDAYRPPEVQWQLFCPDEWWHFNDLGDPAALAGPPIFGRTIGLPTH